MADTWNYEGLLTWDMGGAALVDALPVALKKSAATFTQLDSGLDGTGSNFVARIERVGLPLRTKYQRPSVVNLITGVWPQIHGTVGDVINIYVGAQSDYPTDAPTYTGPFPFTIGVTEFIDTLISGRFACIKFESNLSRVWTLLGYEIEFTEVGTF